MVENVAIKPGDAIKAKYIRHDDQTHETCCTYGVVSESKIASNGLSLRYIVLGDVYQGKDGGVDYTASFRVDEFLGQQVPSDEETPVFSESSEFGRYDLQKIADTEVPEEFQARLRANRFRH